MMKFILPLMFMCCIFTMTWEIYFVLLMLVSISFLMLLNNELLAKTLMSLDLGGSLMGFGLSLLSIWIIALMVLASSSSQGTPYKYQFFIILLQLILIMLMMIFLSPDLFAFYLSFEAVLIPTYILIMGWGYQPERLQAGIYLLFYTLLASLPLLITILYLNFTLGVLLGDFMPLNTMEINWMGFGLYVSGLTAFFVKLPLFLFHLWLPSAHVQAPISGSMLLAGILLKMGGYGLFRLTPYFMKYLKFWGVLWAAPALLGAIYLSLICLRQSDMKSLIAYSSVVHMSLVVVGLISMNVVGLMGSFVLMVGHGLCSSGMFCLANMNYTNLQSRSMMLNRGLMSLVPSGALVWFLLSSSNMSAPPSLNLLGEILLISSILSWSFYTWVLLAFISFFSACYSLYIYSITQHGEHNNLMFNYFSLQMSDYILIMLHWLPLNILFMKSDLFYL